MSFHSIVQIIPANNQPSELYNYLRRRRFSFAVYFAALLTTSQRRNVSGENLLFILWQLLSLLLENYHSILFIGQLFYVQFYILLLNFIINFADDL